jgi:protoporphyrinogen oxidase
LRTNGIAVAAHRTVPAKIVVSTAREEPAGAHVAVIGAGVLGLTLALRLANAGHRVVVYETGTQPGGLATWFDYGEFVWDKYYHVITVRDADLLALIAELGLADQVVWEPTKVGFLWNNRHLSLSSHREFVTFPALSPLQKARLAAGLLATVACRPSAHHEQVPAAGWLRRVFGAGVTDTLWQPLLASKFGPLADRVPASFMIATIQRTFGTRSQADGSERLGYLHGGYRTFFRRVIERLRSLGADVRLATPVRAVEPAADGRVDVHTADGSATYGHLVSTIPNPLFRRIASGIPDLVGGATGEPAFLGVICLTVVLDRALSRFYVTNLLQRDLPFTGIIEYTALANPAVETAGRHLVYLPRYEPPDSPWFDRSDADVTESGLAALEPIWPDLRRRVVRSVVNRERRVQAIWLPGTRQSVEPLRSRSLPIESITAELVGLDTLNNNAIVRLANAHGTRLAAQLAGR